MSHLDACAMQFERAWFLARAFNMQKRTVMAKIHTYRCALLGGRNDKASDDKKALACSTWPLAIWNMSIWSQKPLCD